MRYDHEPFEADQADTDGSGSGYAVYSEGTTGARRVLARYYNRPGFKAEREARGLVQRLNNSRFLPAFDGPPVGA